MDTSAVNIYGGGGQGTNRKSAMNASRISNNTTSSVLSERVHRISEKINEIHVSYHNSSIGNL